MRIFISLVAASVLFAISQLTLAETVSSESAETEISSTSSTPDNSTEATKPAVPANTTEPPKQNAEAGLPTCVPK